MFYQAEVPITIVLKPTVDLNAVTQEITEIVQEVVAPQLDRTLPIEVEASSSFSRGKRSIDSKMRD